MLRRNVEVSPSVLPCYSDYTRGAHVLQSVFEHCDWSCQFNRYEWVRQVWPILTGTKTQLNAVPSYNSYKLQCTII